MPPLVVYVVFVVHSTNLSVAVPTYVDVAYWQQAIEDARRFLPSGESRLKFWVGLRPTYSDCARPKPPPSYRRLSRYDETGLIWLLNGRPVIALTTTTAAVQTPSGAILTYRRHRKPPLGPMGDSLDDMGRWGSGSSTSRGASDE